LVITVKSTNWLNTRSWVNNYWYFSKL